MIKSDLGLRKNAFIYPKFTLVCVLFACSMPESFLSLAINLIVVLYFEVKYK